MRIVSEFVSVCNSECTMKPASPEMREEGGAQVDVCWGSCGGLGGNARFTMVSRGPSPTKFTKVHKSSTPPCGGRGDML